MATELNSNPNWAVGPLSESYVNRGDQRNPEAAAGNRWIRMRMRMSMGTGEYGEIWNHIQTYANIASRLTRLTDWLTYWHMMFGMSVVWLAVCIVQKALSMPNKMKVKNCVHVNTSHISVMPRNQTTNRLGPAVSTSFSQCLFFLFFFIFFLFFFSFFCLCFWNCLCLSYCLSLMLLCLSYWLWLWPWFCCLQCISDILLIEEATATLTHTIRCIHKHSPSYPPPFLAFRFISPFKMQIFNNIFFVVRYFRHNQYAIS